MQINRIDNKQSYSKNDIRNSSEQDLQLTVAAFIANDVLPSSRSISLNTLDSHSFPGDRLILLLIPPSWVGARCPSNAPYVLLLVVMVLQRLMITTLLLLLLMMMMMMMMMIMMRDADADYVCFAMSWVSCVGFFLIAQICFYYECLVLCDATLIVRRA